MGVRRLYKTKQEKEHRWNKLLFLLNEDPVWYLKPNTELYKEITELGKEIFKKETQIGIDKIDEEKYFTLKQYGYRMEQIAQAFHVSKNTLYRWRKENGYINKRKQEAVNQ